MPSELANAAAYIENSDPYVFDAWSKALQAQGVTVVSDKQVAAKSEQPLLFWYEDYDKYDFEERDSYAQWVYSYIYRKAITRKNYLGRTILHYRVKRPGSILFKAWPESFDLELDYPEFLDDALDESFELKQELESSNKTWILKPALGERAHGIRLFRTQDDLQAIFDEQMGSEEGDESDMRHYVVQEYIANPLLIDDRKFHLRVYVLCVGKLQVYVYSHVLTLFSGTKYDANDLSRLDSHLTNTCFQGDQAKVSLLEDELAEPDAAKVLKDVCDVVHDLFEAAHGDPINFSVLPNAIEFFGLDFLIDEALGVHLLEVNAYPDFKQTGGKLRHVVDNLFKETVGVAFSGVQAKELILVNDFK